MHTTLHHTHTLLAGVLLSIGIGALLYHTYTAQALLAQEQEHIVSMFATSTDMVRAHMAHMRLERDTLAGEKTQLTSTLIQEQLKNSEFQTQLNVLASSVHTIVKEAANDEELLQKYSKVYFLNENYSPKNLVTIDQILIAEENKTLLFHAQAYPFLVRMIAAATAQGIDIRIASAFRSFEEQAGLKSRYKMTYGSGANAFSADQGYSEHQLGTTLDFTTTKTLGSFDKFKTTPAYTWLRAHAHEYGFVLSYPEGNSYYISEPWHWRFVGIPLATHLFTTNKHFYDLDQRTIDTYRATMFD
jgi:LAS superfamily LD-carboxypeptidase LdcB